MNILQKVLVLSVASVCSATCASAEQAKATDLSPVRLSSLTTPQIEKSGQAPFRLTFRVQNVSDEQIRQIDFEAKTVDLSGRVVGFRGFPLKMNLKPGEEQFFSYSTGEQKLAPDESIQLVATQVAGFRRQWDLEAMRKSDPTVAEATLRSEVEKAGPADTCDTRCAAKETVCETTCGCGVDTFTCGCGVGTFSYSCKCYRCN